MRNSISHISSGFFSSKTLLLGVLIFAALFIPLYVAQAGFFDGLINVIIKGAAGLVDALVFPIALLVKFVAGLIGDVMYEAIKFFTNIPIVPPKAPDAITNGWNFTRNLVNIIFILILTFIGLATILRLQTYQLQKTLPSLIIIALLVNFSTVLVGFVVDIGNIFTNAFLDKASGADWKNIGSFSFSGNPAANLATHVAEIFYYLFAVLIYFVLILLFAVRTIILWVLTILSPIAFGAYVLPGTKKYWNQWLQTLIQWSILGIPISFSLLLAKGVLSSANFGTNLGLADGSAPASLMAPFTALVLLFVGITLSMQLAPAGAQGVINMGKKAGMKAGGWAAREGWRKIGKGAENGAGEVRKKGQDIATNAEMRLKDKSLGFGQRVGARLSWARGKTLSAIGSGAEIGSKDANARIRARDEAAIAAGEKLTGKDSQKGLTYIREEGIKPALQDNSKMLGAFTQIIKNGDTDDLVKAVDNGEISWDLVRKMYKNSVDNGNTDQRRLIEKAFLSRALDKKDAQGNTIENSNELGVSAKDQKKIFEKITGQDITSGVIGAESLDVTKESGRMVMEEIIKNRGADLMPQILRNTNKEDRQKVSQYLNDKGIQWFVDNGAEDVLRYSLSSGAASLGINPIGGITQDQMNEISSMRSVSSQSLQKRVTDLNAKKYELEQRISLPNLSGLTNTSGTPISRGITSEQREIDEAELRKVKKELEQYTEEQARRQRRQTGQTAPVEEQPLSVQIAQLKQQEEQLKQTAGKQVGPVRIGGVKYLPGDNAMKELKKVRDQRAKLEQELSQQPEDLKNIEASILKEQGAISNHQKGISTYDGVLQGLNQEASALQGDIRETRNDPNATQEEIQELERLLGENGRDIAERQREKEGLEQNLIEAQTHLAGLMTDWKEYKHPVAGDVTIESDIEVMKRGLADAEKQEKEVQEKVKKLMIQKAPTTEINPLRETLRKTKGERVKLENSINRAQRVTELRAQLAAARSLDQEAGALEESRKALATKLEQQQNQLQTIRERAGYRVLRDNPSLGMGSRTFQQEAERRVTADPDVQQRTALLQRAEERLAEARKQLEALPEAMRVTPPPELLRTIEISQRRIPEIQRDIQNSKDRALRQLVRKEKQLAKSAIDSPDLQKAVEGLPEITRFVQEIQTASQDVTTIEREIEEKREDRRARGLDSSPQEIQKEIREIRQSTAGSRESGRKNKRST